MTMTTPKARFKAWLENEQKTDEMIAFAEIPVILSKLGKNLAVICGNRYEKRMLHEWIKCFRIDIKCNLD